MIDGNLRCNFLKTTATAGVGYWLATSSGQAQSRSANERNHASIGADGMGNLFVTQVGSSLCTPAGLVELRFDTSTSIALADLRRRIDHR
jgi:hypothetical protein